jgi:rRNA maturation RNase YbeY
MVDIKVTVRGPVPLCLKSGKGRIPFERIARVMLPRTYELSLVICGDTLARALNVRYRKKTYEANVLSFPLSRGEGEVFLNVRKASREARALRVTERARLLHLFIHALLHLKGLRHGRTMETSEWKLLRRFGAYSE